MSDGLPKDFLHFDPIAFARWMGAVDQKLETVLRTQSEDRQSSAAYRTDIRHELSNINSKVTELATQLRNTTADVGEIQPLVRELDNSRQRQDGALLMGRSLTRAGWAVILAAAGCAGWVMHLIFPRS
jgi:hypothetical protein